MQYASTEGYNIVWSRQGLNIHLYMTSTFITLHFHLLKLLYMSIQYVIQGHMHRLCCNTLHKTRTVNPQMDP